MNTNKYFKQAKEFCDKFGVTYHIVLVSRGKFFKNDAEARDIYVVTLKRGNNEYRFEFGNSIHNSKNHRKPNIYDILACLTKYDPEDIDSFASNYGYTKPSEALYYYIHVKEEWQNVERLFSDCLEELREIQ